ncbi:hypothetical protein GOBAR_AA37754 [Gossypium barbadense]|uniref:Exportin-T n=1 Tax=Gossypium barbadense TaxID=3634 RepID=A0A2P5VVT6_GOSBA|nr:hypothetical protein GOBAR_AA37754 [Gossypium barbadense]
MDDVEKAILISFDESGAIDSELKLQAVNFCQKIKETPSICSLCIEKLCFCKLVQVQFWCLQALQEVIRVKYGSMSLEEKNFIRKSIFSMACLEGINDKMCVVLDSPAFIKNKLSQVLVTLIYFEYPLIWSSVFVDFLPHLSKGAVVIDMFSRLLNALDDELVSMDYPRTAEEVAVAGRVKDAMRNQCVPQIVRAWYDIVSMYRNTDPETCVTVLDCMRRYVSWIDIGLIVNDAFIPLLFELILVDGLLEQLRAAAAGCVLAVVSKRMDAHSKLSLLKSLQISRVFGLVSDDNDSDLVSAIAALITGYAVEVLECSKRVNTEDAKVISMELLDEVLPTVFYVMQNCEMDAAFSIVQFLSGYVATMKTHSSLQENQMLHISQILEVIRTQIRYDPMYRNNLDMSLQDVVARFTSMNLASREPAGSEDGAYVFEAIGLLIGMEDVSLEKQSDYLSSLLTPLCQQVEVTLMNAKALNPDESSLQLANIQQIIVAINALSKGFSERLVTSSRPAVGHMFKQTLDVLLQILVVFPKVEPLRTKVLSFIHRMVDTLGASVFPYLPKALEQLLAESEPKEMVGFLLLLNQLICKFSTLVRDILEEVFPTIAGRVFSAIQRVVDSSVTETNTEEIRELQELQKTLYTFLHVIATHDLSSVFLSPRSRDYLTSIMQLLLHTSCHHKDIVTRKACVQIFIKLIKDWCAKSSGEEKVPGFKSFIIETFATNCCLYSVLDKSFEFGDANTKVMYEKFGDDFLLHFVSKGFPSPQNLAEQYCQKLKGNDIKALRSYYQSLIEHLRVQQNGSLVFR